MLATSDDAATTEHILTTFEESDLGEIHRRAQVDHEHGENFITCLICGAQWGVHDIVQPGHPPIDEELYGDTTDVSYEQVSEGDGYCAERFLEKEGESCGEIQT